VKKNTRTSNLPPCEGQGLVAIPLATFESIVFAGDSDKNEGTQKVGWFNEAGP
jgi:hypothetical protein